MLRVARHALVRAAVTPMVAATCLRPALRVTSTPSLARLVAPVRALPTPAPRRSVHTTSVPPSAAAAPATAATRPATPTPPPPPAAAAGMKVFVNGVEYDVPRGATVLQACEVASIDVPRFCYHDRLSIAGNCRMCLVEVEKSPKPVASCAMPAMPGMRIKTNTPMVKKAREGVMEFLLANHPLDCPICDQGGECDLQDQSVVFGSDVSRFREWKRTVEDKNLGPLVKTVMTRCIHCTRCVRFSSEICGVDTLGTTGRGNGMEIGTYIDKVFDSELSGNVVDLCPVGALTSKPFAFTARPWELVSTETIDVLDSVNPAIRVDTRGTEIMRILPRLHEEVNEEWISDKSRYSYDGLKRQRLDTPLIKVGDEFRPASWEDAFAAIQKRVATVKGSEMLAIAGDLVESESLVCLKDLFNRLGSGNLQLNTITPLSADSRADYLFNSTIAGIEDADVVLLVGSNPRMESPLICSRIRKSVRHSGQKVYSIGPEANLALPHKNLGNRLSVIGDIINDRIPAAARFKKAKRPLVLVGAGALTGPEGKEVLAALTALRAAVPALLSGSWNGINLLQTATSNTAALDIGFRQGVRPPAPAKFVYLLGADEFDESRIPRDAFVVYQGHHGDAGATRADVILAGAAYTEKSGTYVNVEGRVQRSAPSSSLIAQSREDWQILRALSDVLSVPLPYDSLDGVRSRLVDIAPHFANVGHVESASFLPAVETAPAAAPLAATPLRKPFHDNFFFTNPISRSSRIMARASAQLPVSRNSYISSSSSSPTARVLTQ